MGLEQTTHQSTEYYCKLKNETYDHVQLEENVLNCTDLSDYLTAQDLPNKDPKTTYTRPDLGLRVACESEKENRIRNIRPSHLVVDGFTPATGSSPYVFHGATSPPTTPSGRCKSPFVPSFKSVTKVLAFPSFLWAKVDAFIDRLNRWTKSADSLAEHFWAHIKLGGSVSETVWGKVSLGTKIVTEGGVDNLFKLSFSVGPREKLVKTSSCYLSTSTGPIAGLLFISTEKIAFCSDRPLSFTSPNKKTACTYYRVAIPLGRAGSVNQYENMNKPSEKYIQIQTVDDHEFWLMGFVNYKKALKHLQQAIRSH
ncbi:hypothetical protein KI387_033560 [Taxus chinensis]|uniref:GRAM domain-containing protein n=1 Tax=Taxus chinensis TaxID=29808 RepID=A0AA38C467_TAXCH|nr:hypothetical protein KI387_033560 [Taxus chinensis]